MRATIFISLLTLFVLAANIFIAAAQVQTSDNTTTMMIGEDGAHCGSREIADYGTSTPVVIAGTDDTVPKGIYGPYYDGFIHGLIIVFNLPDPSDLTIKLGGRLDYIDLANRTDDIKVFMNNQLSATAFVSPA